jgi:predicted PurR-regulated permease PerM
MPVLEILEQRGLFRLTRFVAFIIVLLLTIGLVVGAVMFLDDFLPNHASHVSYSTIAGELRPAPQSNEPAPSESETQPLKQDSLRLPFVLQPYFSTTENRAVLKSHLSGLDSDEREDYLTNLAEVVQTAKEQNADVTAVINRYFEDKATQMELAKLDQTSRLERQLYVAGAAASTILLIALASLVLVLLAIERNTRKPSEVGLA